MPKESKPIVLVADDEPSMVAMLASHLRSKGYTVLEASDGDQAWELAHEHLPNLVLLDVMMPGMSGWEVCRKIREAVSLAHTGVIMLTGIGENLNEMTSPLYGADAYLDKPFEFSDLDRKISETITRRAGGALGRADGEGDDERGVKKAGRATTSAKKPVKAKDLPRDEERELPVESAPDKKARNPKSEPKLGGPPEKAATKPPLAKAKGIARPEPDADTTATATGKERGEAKPRVKAPTPKAQKTNQPAPMPVPTALKERSKPVAKVAPQPANPPAAKVSAPPAGKKPALALPKPAKSAPKPAKSAPKPAKSAPKPAKSAPKPVKSAPKPAKSAPKPAKSAPKPVKSAPKPAKSAPKPAKPAPKPAKSAPKPAKSAPKPAKSAPKPAKSAPKPAKSAPKPAKSAPKPAKSAPKPAKKR